MFKKCLASLAALSIVAACIPSALAAETQTVPSDGGTIQFEDLFDIRPGAIGSDENADGGKYVLFSNSDSKPEYETTFNVTETGVYTVDFLANRGSSKVTTSGVKMYINDMLVLDTFESDGYNKLDNVYPNASYEILDFYGNSSIYLTAGSHKIKFDYYSPSSAGGKYRYAADCIKFEKVQPVTLPEDGVIEFEEFFYLREGLLWENENASGGKFLYNPHGSSEGIDYHHNVLIVPEEGDYSVHMIAGRKWNPAFVSKCSLFIDGKEVVNNQVSETELSPRYPVGDEYNPYAMADHIRKVHLAQGEHTVGFRVYPAYSNNNYLNFSLDCIKFVKEEPAELTDGKLEFEDVFNMSDLQLLEDENASGGKYLMENGRANTLNYKGYFNVPESGCYDISYISTAEEARITLSDSELYIDGKYIRSSRSAISSEPYSDIAFHGLYYMKKIKGYNAVYLEKGIHQAEFALRANGGTNVKFLADCIQFTKRNVTEIDGTIQAEDLFGVDEGYVVDNANASGGKVVNGDWSPVKEFGGEINVTEEGTYNIEFVGSKAGGNSYVSCGTMYIDGTEVFSQAGSMNDRGELVYSLGDGDWCKVCKYNLDPVYLSEGKHSIKMVYTYPTSDTSKGIRWALDTLTFTKDNTEEVFETNLGGLEPYYSEYGTNDERVIVYRNGVEIQNGSTYQITYASSNENVITIDGNGTIILGGKTGYSEISVVISRGGRVVSTLFGSLYVIDDNVVYVRNAKYGDNKVSFDVENPDGVTYKGVAVVATYNATGELCDVHVVNIDETNAQTKSLESSVTGGVKAKVFLLESLKTLKPLWQATEISK